MSEQRTQANVAEQATPVNWALRRSGARETGGGDAVRSGCQAGSAVLIADFLRPLEPGEVCISIGFLTGWPRQGKLGIGWAARESARPPATATSPDRADP